MAFCCGPRSLHRNLARAAFRWGPCRNGAGGLERLLAGSTNKTSSRSLEPAVHKESAGLPVGTSGPAFANLEHAKLFQTAVDLRMAGDYADGVNGGTTYLRTPKLPKQLSRSRTSHDARLRVREAVRSAPRCRRAFGKRAKHDTVEGCHPVRSRSRTPLRYSVRGDRR